MSYCIGHQMRSGLPIDGLMNGPPSLTHTWGDEQCLPCTPAGIYSPRLSALPLQRTKFGDGHGIMQQPPCTMCKLTGSLQMSLFLGKKPYRFHFSHSQPKSKTSTLYSVEPTHASGGRWLTLKASKPELVTAPKTFLVMLHSWGNT